ncbi:hypothetical protein ACI1G1_001572 [Vibrio cholerae]
MMKNLMNKIHSDIRLSAIFYGVVSSLISTVLWTHSWTILTILGDFSFGYSSAFVDSRFAKAASLEPTNYAYYLIVFLFLVVSLGWFEISARISKKLKSDNANVSDEKAEMKDNGVLPKWVSPLFFSLRAFVFFYLLYGLIIIAGEITILNSIDNFNQHIRIITPYISKDEKEMLISEWSQMRNAKDYNVIYEKLAVIAKDNNLVLYKNKNY